MTVDELLVKERELISYIKTNWLYSHIQQKSQFAHLNDISLPDNYRIITTKIKPFACEFKNCVPTFSQFLEENKKYKTNIIRLDAIGYIVDDVQDIIVGGVVLKDKQLAGLFETMNFFDNACKDKWCFHTRVFHFANVLDKTLFDMVKFEVLCN